MSQAKDWSKRPTTKQAEVTAATNADNTAAIDRLVTGEKGAEEHARLNVNIPKSLRARVKAGCAMRDREIKDVVIELLEREFPA